LNEFSLALALSNSLTSL